MEYNLSVLSSPFESDYSLYVLLHISPSSRIRFSLEELINYLSSMSNEVVAITTHDNDSDYQLNEWLRIKIILENLGIPVIDITATDTIEDDLFMLIKEELGLTSVTGIDGMREVWSLLMSHQQEINTPWKKKNALYELLSRLKVIYPEAYCKILEYYTRYESLELSNKPLILRLKTLKNNM